MSRRRALVIMAAAAMAAMFFAFGARYAATAYAGKADEAWLRYDDEKAMARRYEEAQAVAIQVSADSDEARSSETLTSALSGNGIGAGDRNVTYNNPAAAGGLMKLTININIPRAKLASVAGFLRQVDVERRNLGLTEITMNRDGDTADSWAVNVNYAALIAAK